MLAEVQAYNGFNTVIVTFHQILNVHKCQDIKVIHALIHYIHLPLALDIIYVPLQM